MVVLLSPIERVYMSEILYEDGSKELRSHIEMFGNIQAEPKFQPLFDLLMKKEVKSVTLHKTGDLVEKDGKNHIVMDDGSWRECVKMADGAIFLIDDSGKLHQYKERDA